MTLTERWRVIDGRAPMHGTPDQATPLVSELVRGDGFTVLERSGDWMRGRNEFDGYEGWTPADALGEGPEETATHVVADLRAFVYPSASMKNPVEDALPLGSRVVVAEIAGDWAQLADGGWVFARHLAPPDRFEPDIVKTAERLLGVPYLWGGRTPWGLDCSGLSQLALARAGVAITRDSGPQSESVGIEISPTEIRRGDLVFFAGHVARRAGGILKSRRPSLPG